MERSDDNKDDNHNDTNLTSTNHIVACIHTVFITLFFSCNSCDDIEGMEWQTTTPHH